jgi:uncharacterized protein
MSQTIRFDKQVTAATGRYIATIDGEAEITFTVRGPARITADHTLAPDIMRGTGVALKLVKHMIADARASCIKIAAVCPYVQAQYRKHPEWQDFMTT